MQKFESLKNEVCLLVKTFTCLIPKQIGNNVFVGSGSIILPGVTIGNNVIVGAGSVVRTDIPDDSVVTGNPATII